MQSMKSRILRAEEFPELPIQMEADLGLHGCTSRVSLGLENWATMC